MPEPGQDGRDDEQMLWPVVDDDELPRYLPESAEETHQFPVPPPLPPAPPRTSPPPLSPPPPRAPWPPAEPPRAAPARFGPPPVHEPAPVQPSRPRRGRRTALIVVIALGLAFGAGTGVVFGVPGLAGKLGLTNSEPEVVIAAAPPPVEFAPALRAPSGQSPAPTPAGVKAALAGPADSPALGTLAGMVVDSVTGDVLWDQGSGTPLVPASTGKLLTAAAALLSVDHTAQLTTKVVAGQKPGSVVLIGGGDPTLSSLKVDAESVYPGAARLADLVAQVKASAGAIDTVLVDVSRYAGDSMAPGWDNRDIVGGYIAPIVPAMLDGGRGDATKATTSRTDNPARALATEFATRLGAKVPGDAKGTAPEGAKVLGEVRSAPMVELVDTLLLTSDNVLAEAIAHEVARVTGAEVSFAGASKATLDILQRNGFDTNGVSFVDGSGLSTQDKVPAGLLAKILAVAAGPDGKDPRTAKLRPLLGGLPVAGGSGTLAGRYQKAASTSGKGWVRAKTGTLSGVNSLAGVVLDADGRLLVFALLTSGSDPTPAREALDTVAASLRKCGCG